MTTELLTLTGSDLTPETIAQVARASRPVALAPEALARMAAGRAVVERHLAEDRPVYGLTTGLGARVTHRLPREALAEFSRLTLLGRANAVGPRLPAEVVRALMVVRVNGLLHGGAGATPRVAEALAELLNAKLNPVMPGIGSIGWNTTSARTRARRAARSAFGMVRAMHCPARWACRTW